MKGTKLRKVIAGFLVFLGVVLMVLAPETFGGLVLIIVGICIEVVGIALEKKRSR